MDGVIIGGGDDISPQLYGSELVAEARLDPARDAMERSIVMDATERGLPILGICRGAQMLNIALGGALDQNAYDTFGAKVVKTLLPRKTVCLESESRLERITGPNPMRVNALHTQTVKALGEGLRVAARDTSGMVQGIERSKDPVAIGVQWHPEHLVYARRQRRIFRALAEAARAYRDQRQQLDHVDALLDAEPAR